MPPVITIVVFYWFRSEFEKLVNFFANIFFYNIFYDSKATTMSNQTIMFILKKSYVL